MIVPVMLALFLQRFIEEFRVQRDALQRYLDLMSDLLLNHDLLDAEPGSDVVAIAQAQTLTTLRQMDSQGKRTVVLFLLDARLIQAPAGSEPVIDLAEANLSNADLSGANVDGADLTSANLKDADLSGAEGLTDEQLVEVQSLEGATMPNGQILSSDDNPDGPTFEEWLKSKGREEDGKNSRPS